MVSAENPPPTPSQRVAYMTRWHTCMLASCHLYTTDTIPPYRDQYRYKPTHPSTGEVTHHARLWKQLKTHPCFFRVLGPRHFSCIRISYAPKNKWSTFGSWDTQKVHAAVARRVFPSQNVQNTPTSEHFWKLRCSKSAHRRGAKHISQSKCWKHHMLGPYLDVQMLFRVAGARDSAPSQKWAKREGFVAVSKHWQAWGAWRESAKMHVAWQVQCKRHMIQKC